VQDDLLAKRVEIPQPCRGEKRTPSTGWVSNNRSSEIFRISNDDYSACRGYLHAGPVIHATNSFTPVKIALPVIREGHISPFTDSPDLSGEMSD
jgi:hypothetical protein